jgi:hypothetical protein
MVFAATFVFIAATQRPTLSPMNLIPTLPPMMAPAQTSSSAPVNIAPTIIAPTTPYPTFFNNGPSSIPVPITQSPITVPPSVIPTPKPTPIDVEKMVLRPSQPNTVVGRDNNNSNPAMLSSSAALEYIVSNINRQTINKLKPNNPNPRKLSQH